MPYKHELSYYSNVYRFDLSLKDQQKEKTLREWAQSIRDQDPRQFEFVFTDRGVSHGQHVIFCEAKLK